ncbi:MAG: efflux RND transporter periplasmic adaptor subunit [Petrimonas sp.]|uniref:efflux RND transporter periplasmic adaptor subunit n=2 Tax=Petrimonas sp. TaxID=2023866 RepID=UPI002B3F220C|nr:efflux RND transporter periplasmic adaptor subunit [Petrimonas sp.]MEA5045434.1 efflux RND transporter periplasmic adaptor subunit [Petrimonas sp.]
MKINRTILYTTCFATLLFGGCSKKATSGDTEANAQTAVKVTVKDAVEMEYTPVLNFTGTAEPNKEVNLGSAIPGRIEKINYPKGSFVPKGAVIAEMSDEMLIQAEIELETIRKDFERISRLKEKGSVSIMDYDHIKAKFEASQTKVDMLKKNTSITAPFGGVLVDIMVNEGENYSFVPSVSPDLKMKSGIATLMQLNPLKVKIEINEKELNAVRKGQSVGFTFDAYPNENVSGKIADISPVLSPLTRTFTVEVVIPNNGTKLKPGMFCRASIEMPPAKGVFVPVNAIHRQQGTGDDFVFVVNEDNTVTRTKVTRGESQNKLIRIPELDKNSVVVIDGKNKLNDNSKIEIVK